MIGYIEGKLISKKPTQVLINANGVGYIVNISINTFENLAEIGESASLFTHLSVRENAMDLFGFYEEAEKAMFELLISVNGIGPKLALSILSGIKVEELKEAVSTGNLSRIIAVPGIGRKTGERLLIELRDKVESVGEQMASGSLGTYAIKNDAVAALTSLGYNIKVAEKAVRSVVDKNAGISIEELVKVSLSMLNK
ncbi:MAG: Holliday junction branch migration protein RuvA [Melioribacteraceae bacterium]|nr:Holliday junction branch migration protein RuvA [Melioribacteraceae bacterium]